MPKNVKHTFTREYRKLEWKNGKNLDRYVVTCVDKYGKDNTSVRHKAYANAGSSAEKMTSHVYRWGR